MRYAALALLLACGAPQREMRPPPEVAFPTQASANGGTPPEAVPTPSSENPDPKPYEVGLASWYGQAFAGKKTTNGERFDPKLYTAAHKKLPFGTWVEVRRVDTGRSVRVRINDRGPNGRAAHRIIDLSRRAAEDIDLVRNGVAQVEVRIVDGP